jgi:hypothetical protein
MKVGAQVTGLGAASQTLLEIVDRDTAGLEGRIFQNESVKIGIHGDVLDPLLGQSGLHPGDALSTIRAGGHDLGDRRVVVRRYVRPGHHVAFGARGGADNKKAALLRGRPFELVAGAGFEPTTFRL